MTKRRREPDATTNEKIELAKSIARMIAAIFEQIDLPPPIGISACLMVATDAAMQLDGDIKAAAIETLTALLEQMQEPVRLVADEPQQKM